MNDITDELPGDDGTRVYRDTSTDAVRQLSADDLAALRRLAIVTRHYTLTGVQVIDDLLCAISWASDFHHDATRWAEEVEFKYGPLREDENFADLIQSLANDGADEIRKAILR